VPPGERIRLVELKDDNRPEGVDDAARLMVPANPPRLFIVTVLVPDPPIAIVSDIGFKEIV
jgi:hypothetical protein